MKKMKRVQLAVDKRTEVAEGTRCLRLAPCLLLAAFAANAAAADQGYGIAFAAHGGKLLVWAGWEDPQIFVWDTVNFFEYMIRHNAKPGDGQLIDMTYENPEYPYGNTTLFETLPSAARNHLAALGEQAHQRAVAATNQFAKLYMASGVNHCGGGPGAQSFTQANGELTQALFDWVENDVPPGDITIKKTANNSPTGAVQFTTLLCSYPKSLTYKGSGDLLSASNYVCE